MKILFVCDSLGSGGAQKLLVDLALSFNDNISCDFVILEESTDRYSTILKKAGINVAFLSNTMKSHVYNIRMINEKVKMGGYDIIHVNLFPSTYYLSILKMMKQNKYPPIVMTEHSTDNRRRHIKLFKPVEKAIYDNYEHIISISEQTQSNLTKWLGEKNTSRYSVIENGVNLRTFNNAKPYRKSDLIETINKNDVLIGLIGSFTPQKNHINMLKALSLLPEYYRLVLVGEGPLKQEIKNYAIKEKIIDRVFFLGFREDVARIIKTLDVVVIPSLWEGFGLIAVETMASGVPVVISNVAGLREVVGECGLIFDPQNPFEIANALEQSLISEEKENRINKGIEVSQHFSIEHMRDRYLELFDNIIIDNKR